MAALRLVLLLVLLTGCDSASEPTAFDVTFRGLDGVEVSQAELRFDRPGIGERTEGTFQVTSGVSLSTTGRLDAAGLDNGNILVTLDPKVADGGVEFEGPFRDAPYEGEWSAGTIAGPMPGGTFRSVPR